MHKQQSYEASKHTDASVEMSADPDNREGQTQSLNSEIVVGFREDIPTSRARPEDRDDHAVDKESRRRRHPPPPPQKPSDPFLDENEDHTSLRDHTRWRLNMALDMILILVVVSTLSWVAIWTCLAAHTDIARFTIYPAFETQYFDDKDGARVFTYLGVFYLFAGAASLALLSLGANLPKPSPALVKALFRIPGASGVLCRKSQGGFQGAEFCSALDIIAMSIFVAVQVATIVTRIELKFQDFWSTEKMWYEVSKTLGKTAALTLTVILLPVSKNCFWLDIFNLKFERSIKFHRWLGWFFVVVVAIHAATAMASLTIAGQFKNCMWPSEDCVKPAGGGWHRILGSHGSAGDKGEQGLATSRVITYGWFACVAFLPLVVTSLPYFRRNKFEWFYYTHFLFIPAMILLHVHYASMIYYTAPGLAAYTLDKTLWYCSSRRPVKLLCLTTPVPGFVRMVLAVEPSHNFEVGQWVQLNVPSVSFWQWHPMSVASAPGNSSITIDVKVLGDWTRGLEDLANRFDPNRPAHTCVFLDQFHGSSHTQMQGYLNHPAVLMVAGGIGITPLLSAVRTLVEDSSSLPVVKRAVLVWVVRKESVVNLYRAELGKIQALTKTTAGCKVDVFVHATLSEKEDELSDGTVSMEIESPKAHHVKGSNGTPFMQHVMGYCHKLALTVGAGGGFLLGLLCANMAAYDKTWPKESKALLQLGLSVSFSAILVAIGMSGSMFRPAAKTIYQEGDEATVGTHMGESTSSSLDNDAGSSNEECPLAGGKIEPNTDQEHHIEMEVMANAPEAHSDENSEELRVVLGCRPDLQHIVNDVKSWSVASGYQSVGVAVCGPDKLVCDVVNICGKASSSTLPFVVDAETFEW